MDEYVGISWNPSNPHVSFEKTSRYPSDNIYHGDNNLVNPNGELNGFKTRKEKKVQDPDIQYSSKTSQILDGSDSHGYKKF